MSIVDDVTSRIIEKLANGTVLSSPPELQAKDENNDDEIANLRPGRAALNAGITVADRPGPSCPNNLIGR